MRVPEGAGTLQEFMAASGRSDTNPYGDSGLFGGGVNFTNSMTPKQIADVNQLAYNQYLGLVSGRGTQRGGQGEFVPGYAPALKIGSNTPSGRVVAAPTQPKQGGIADFFNLSPTLGILRSLFGRGNIPRTLDDGGVDYSTEGIETLDAAPVLKPGEAAAPAPSFTLASAQNQDNNSLFNLGGFIENLPKTGVGRFVDQVQERFKVGPGSFGLDFNPEKRQVGLNYKIQIAQQDPQAFARDQALANQNRTQLEYPEGVERRSLYEGLASPGTGLRLEDLVGPNKVADLSDLSDSASFGNPYAGTTGAFVPKRIEIAPDGKLIEVPVGFDKGGEVVNFSAVDFSQEGEGIEGLFSQEELDRQERIASAERQPDGSLLAPDGTPIDNLRFATPEEVDIGAYNHQQHLESMLSYHQKERDKPRPFQYMAEQIRQKIYHQEKVDDLQKRLEQFQGMRGAAVANYRDYIKAGGLPLMVNTETTPYFASFPETLLNFRATNP